MMVLVRWIKYPFDVAVQCSDDADPREHRRPARRRDQVQSLHRRGAGRVAGRRTGLT